MFNNIDPVDLRVYIYFGFWIGFAVILTIYAIAKKWSAEKVIKKGPIWIFIAVISSVFLYYGMPNRLFVLMFFTTVFLAVLAAIAYPGYIGLLFEVTKPIGEGIKKWLKRSTNQNVDPEVDLIKKDELENKPDTSDRINTIFTSFFIITSIILLMLKAYISAQN